MGLWDCICNFHGDTPSASSSSSHQLHRCSSSISPSLYHFLSPSFLALFSLLSHPTFCLPLFFPSFVSQPITLSFLPWRQYYQCSASGKLHPESFLELEIGLVQGWRYSHGKGRACFTHQRVPVSRDSSLPLLLVHLPPPVLKHAVAPVLSPLQHTPTPNRKPLEGRREQNDQSSRTGPADAECSS